MRMIGVATTPSGSEIQIAGNVTPDLERAAEAAGAVAYRYAVDGGVESLRKIAGQWVAMPGASR